MSTSLPLILSRIHNALAPRMEHSMCVYVSANGVHFELYPTTTYGSSINDLSGILPDLDARLAIQVANVYTRQTIDSMPRLVSEMELDVRIVDKAQDLVYSSLHYQRAAFIRADGSLVVWGDDEETTLASWNEIICRVQGQIPPTPVAGLPVDPPSEGPNLDDFGPLSYLYELSFLPSLPEVFPSQGMNNFVDPSWPSWQEGSLGLGAPSPLSDTTSGSMLGSPFTADLENMPPSYPPVVYVGEEEETGSNTFSDFPTTISDDRGASPLSSSQCTVNVPQALAIGQEATPKDEEATYAPQLVIQVNGSDAATADADVDQRRVSNARMHKRSRSDIATSSVPARSTVPLPYTSIEDVLLRDEYASRKLLAIAPAPPPASPTESSTSTFASTPTLALGPMPLRVPIPPASPSPSSASVSTCASSPAAPALEPASGRTPTRRANRRRGAGGSGGAAAARAKSKKQRFPCGYCNKTFSRLQDQQRHSTTSCDASPNRATVSCPECGSILSRVDAAQRHWRGHENPSCAPPEWVSSGRL